MKELLLCIAAAVAGWVVGLMVGGNAHDHNVAVGITIAVLGCALLGGFVVLCSIVAMRLADAEATVATPTPTIDGFVSDGTARVGTPPVTP